MNFYFAILHQFRQKEQNLADKNSIELWNFNLTLVSADEFQIPVLRQAFSVASNLTELSAETLS
ncbi:hypothetical protein [Mucilaginibacter sp.]|uniref:hypothetical protein n=1 Tax=Mucilaginibacter sp. TaxID=1882438 RepID=UPI003B00CD8B